jgi:hypothetical protein
MNETMMVDPAAVFRVSPHALAAWNKRELARLRIKRYEVDLKIHALQGLVAAVHQAGVLLYEEDSQP